MNICEVRLSYTLVSECVTRTPSELLDEMTFYSQNTLLDAKPTVTKRQRYAHKHAQTQLLFKGTTLLELLHSGPSPTK